MKELWTKIKPQVFTLLTIGLNKLIEYLQNK